MNLFSPWRPTSKLFFRIAMNCRRFLPKQTSQAFGSLNAKRQPKIEHIYIINLNRQISRWAEMNKELKLVCDHSGVELLNLAERYAAIDAKEFSQEPVKDADVDPIYTLGEQLFVEPQPLALPTRLDLNFPIPMSRPEVAIARSHINIWRKIVCGRYNHVLILEDDVWFRYGFAQNLDRAWSEIVTEADGPSKFDILYLSYQEVKNGTPKTFLSRNVFRPVRGLWNLSGYVLSREGAEKLLRLLPCRGPVDLWINHHFQTLEVRATRRPIISQRPDVVSTNSYSILPALTKIGAITSESASLFHVRPNERPVFAFGPKGAGLSSLAMALSMLGYRCCNDLETLPDTELEMLLTGKGDRVFDAYVNIEALTEKFQTLRERFPLAKFFITTNKSGFNKDNGLNIIDGLKGADVAFLDVRELNKWRVVCEHLRCAPPACCFPEFADLGQRRLFDRTTKATAGPICEIPKRDESPWVVEPRTWWRGIHFLPEKVAAPINAELIKINDPFKSLDTQRWFLRDDTFTGNLGLFRPSNVERHDELGISLNVRKESLGVREYSAAALTSRDKYLFGKFEAIIRASNVPGVVTGFFLHRDSPRQEIDVEIVGNRADKLLVNVFYNPGGEGAKYDYGYRGAASVIDLGFDASESEHLFSIEWKANEISWLVDNRLVHRRVDWEPTPIPNLPMALHLNTWPSRSKELAGRLNSRGLPATSYVREVSFEANRHHAALNL